MSESQPKTSAPGARRAVNGVLFFISLGAFLIAIIYVTPLLTGGRFAQAMQSLDTEALQGMLCDETSLAQVTGVMQSGGDLLNQVIIDLLGNQVNVPGQDFRQALVVEGNYDPFSSVYSFRFRMANDVSILGFTLDAGVRTPEMAVIIDRTNIFAPCVTV